MDATASIEATVLSPNFLEATNKDQAQVLTPDCPKGTKKGKDLFAKYKRENRLIALYIKLTEWYYDFTNAKGYTDKALLHKRIEQAHAFKLDLALAYFHGTTVAQHFQAKMLSAVMHACDPPNQNGRKSARSCLDTNSSYGMG